MNLTILAIIPCIVILIYIYKKDKVEKEPLHLIALLVFLGMMSCIPAALAENLLQFILPQFHTGSLPFALTNAFLMAAFCEETLKYLVLRLPTWNNPAFNYRFDGIVYGVCSAVGFALFENIFYVSQYGLTTAIFRAFLAVPLHTFCGVFMGTFYAYTKRADIIDRKDVKTKATILSLLIPMMIHGTYDTFAMWNQPCSAILLLTFVGILYVVSIKEIRKMSRLDEFGSLYPKVKKPDLHVTSHFGDEVIATLNISPAEFVYKTIRDCDAKEILLKDINGLHRLNKISFFNNFPEGNIFGNYCKNCYMTKWGVKAIEGNMLYKIQGYENQVKITRENL